MREIARGATRISEIASKTGMETGATSHFLDTLIQLGIVEREMPVTEAAQGKTRSRKSLYTIKDNLFRFWYRFIPGIIDIIQHNSTEKAWEFIAEGFSAYMGRVFETMCRQYLWRENTANRLPFFSAGRPLVGTRSSAEHGIQNRYSGNAGHKGSPVL
jgi:AAA+ ATPase superfamily predicted ATPase